VIKRVISICATLLLGASLFVSQSAFAASTNDSAIGYWMTLDHQNHNAMSSVIKISKSASGEVSGKIVHIFPENGHKVTDKCVFCKGRLYKAPIMGLKLVWGFHEDPSTPGKYTGGYVLDPASGKIYKCNMWLSNHGQQLTVHGYIGISLLGRSDIWLRTHPVNTASKVKAAH
jgi:uncharacterized protein (DUF2147 family)